MLYFFAADPVHSNKAMVVVTVVAIMGDCRRACGDVMDHGSSAVMYVRRVTAGGAQSKIRVIGGTKKLFARFASRRGQS